MADTSKCTIEERLIVSVWVVVNVKCCVIFKLMADTSKCTIEERLIVSVWVRKKKNNWRYVQRNQTKLLSSFQ